MKDIAEQGFAPRAYNVPITRDGNMIVSLDSEDPNLVARVFERYPSDIYGLALPFAPDGCYADILAQGENLFVCGNGAEGRIGGLQGAPCFCPVELTRWLKDCVIPWNYSGHIYVSAPRGNPAFINNLLRHMGEAYFERIHGQFEGMHDLISPFARDRWVSAAA